MTALHPPESSPLSETRLEEIEEICNMARANNGRALEHDSSIIRDCTRCRIGYAIVDLLAEVRRLQSALAAASEENSALRETLSEVASFGELTAEKNPDVLELRFRVSRVALMHGGPDVMGHALQTCRDYFRDYWRRQTTTTAERLAQDIATGLADAARRNRPLPSGADDGQ